MIFTNGMSEMAGAREDPQFAAAIGAQPVDIAAMHENVDNEDLSLVLEQTMLSTRTNINILAK